MVNKAIFQIKGIIQIYGIKRDNTSKYLASQAAQIQK